MEPQDDFKSIWLARISSFKREREGNYRLNTMLSKPAELSEEIDRSVKRALEELRLPADQTANLLRKVREDRSYGEAKSYMNGIISNHRDLLNAEIQTRRADIESKFRFLLFRILTAIGIALVVLGTYYVAQRIGIQLPLVRV